MHEGRISGFLERGEFSEYNVLRWRSASAHAAEIGGRQCSRRNSGCFMLILVVGDHRGVHQPALPVAVNLSNMANLIGLFGMFSIGEGFVIITGGIDLSVGSMFALLGVMFIDLL